MPSRIFSSTVFQGNSAFSWNTKAISCGRGPRSALPETSTVPFVGSISPPTTLRSVLLPQPLGPIRQSSSPRMMSSEVSASARTYRVSPASPNWWPTPLMRTATSPAVMRGKPSRLKTGPSAAFRRSVLLCCRGQEGLGIKLAHIGFGRQRVQIDKRFCQDFEPLLVEVAVVRKHRHHVIVGSANDIGVLLQDLSVDRDSLGLVGAHEGDGFKPALEEGPDCIRPGCDQIVGRENHVGDELGQVGEAHQDAAVAFF